MEPSEALELIALLRDAFPRQAFSADSAKVYAESIVDLPLAETAAVIRDHIQRQKWFPAIAEVRLPVLERLVGAPMPEAAWAEVDEAAREYTPYDEKRRYPRWSHAIVEQTVRTLGGVAAISAAPNSGYERRDFLRFYRAFREQRIERVNLGLTAGDLHALPGGRSALPTGTTNEES